jgi:26S proteasome regulatory subunit T5
MAAINLESKEIWGDEMSAELVELADLTPDQITQRTKMLANNMRAMRSDLASLDQRIKEKNDLIKENTEKVKLNKQLPYLVANVVEVRESFGAPNPARPFTFCPPRAVVGAS